MYLVRYKISKQEAPFYVLTLDQLAKKLDVDVNEPRYRKQKISRVLNKIKEYLKYTDFTFDFVKGDNERWAYTVLISFPQSTIEHFDEGQYAVFLKRFYSDLLWRYAGVQFPEISIGRERTAKISEIQNNDELYKDFLLWANSSQNAQLKKEAYVANYVQAFNRMPEWYEHTEEKKQSTPSPEEFIKGNG